MTSLADNAIALLLDMAERGELDPWNVQVIEVIDRFLSQLQPSETGGRAAYEADLSQSGQAFLYASMLVLLKADSLARAAEAVEVPEEEEILELAGDNPLPLRLERSLRRRAVARPPQSRRVTLAELIAQLEVMATTLAEQTPRTRARRPKPHSRSEALASIAELAHAENLSEVAAAIEKFLRDHWSEISQGQDWMDFEELLEAWAQPGVNPIPSHSPQGDRVAVFWGLLFLSAQSKVELAQTEFYQDLQVRSCSDPVPGSLDANAAAAAADLSLALLD